MVEERVEAACTLVLLETDLCRRRNWRLKAEWGLIWPVEEED
jgi:hypothetical protein